MEDATRLTASELAAMANAPSDRVAALVAVGLLAPGPDGTFSSRDVHVVRLLSAFEASGVPVDALAAGMASGQLDFASYHELHRDPGPPSGRTYGTLRAEIDPDGVRLPGLFTAFGLAEPDDDARPTEAEARHLERWARLLDGVDDRDLLTRVVRLYGEGARRTATAALDVYEEAAERLGPDPAHVDLDAYARLLGPWAEAARELPTLAAWLTERHLRDAIDAFSVETSEQLLAAEGIVPSRTPIPPGIAFVDLTGFTRATHERGDETAARWSLRLGELARAATEPHRGRLVKLLGDGALIHFPDGHAAVTGSFALLDAIAADGLGSGHAGVDHGPVIEREGDVFGRTVNLAARLSDHAPDGALYVTAGAAADLVSAGVLARPVGRLPIQGVGEVDVAQLVRGS